MKKTLLFIILLANVYSASANYAISHYRWRNDDGNETTATWKGAIDDTLRISIHDIDLLRLRVEITANNDVTIDKLSLEYSKDDGVTWLQMTSLNYPQYDDFYISKTNKINYTFVDNSNSWYTYFYAPTTQQMSTRPSFVPGRIEYIEYGHISPSLFLAKGQSTEFEYTIKPTGKYIDQLQKYIFRVTGASGLISQTPTLIIGDCYTTIPSAPTANAEQTFCLTANPTISNLAVADTNIVWYDAAAGGNELPTNTPLVDGNVYYCQKFSYCTVGVPRTAVTARIPDNSVTRKVSICEGETYTFYGIPHTTSGFYTVIKDCHYENLNLTVNTKPVPHAIDNQIFNNNQVTQPIVVNKICATANEGQDIQLTAPAGFVFTSVPFASFGTPDGTCDNFTLGSCHATNSIAVVEGLVLGKNSATIPATNAVFGDPCDGTFKKLYVEATYGTVYWTNNNPSIGLPASGTGTLPSFTAVNSSCTPNWATITVNFYNGFCFSAPQTFTITVNPNIVQTTTTTVCDSYTWPANGIVYTTSGTYSTGTNCNQQILNLTVNKIAPPTGITNQISTSAVTLADLMVTGTNIKWYDAATAGSELPNSTIAIDNTSYYATQTLLGCESTPRTLFTTHKISEATQTVCLNATVNNLITTPSPGKTAKWYKTTTEGAASLTDRTELSNGTYYVQQHEPIAPIVSSLAGGGSLGNVDDIGTIARFYNIYHLAIDKAGNIYAADVFNNSIRKITPAGVVSTFAGSTQGFADGTGTAAQFNRPFGVAIDGFDNLYVTDTYNNKIRKITPEGVVSTLAGSTQGDADGIGTAAQFYHPIGIAVDGAGNLFVTDNLNYKIKKITTDGMVSTVAGTGVAGNTDGIETLAQFNAPVGIAVNAAGTLYVTETRNSQIRKITSDGIVSTFAGSGVQGFADGSGKAAQFNYPIGIVLDATGNLYVGDMNNSKIRKITPTGEVSTFTGSGYGFTDGPLASALFIQPRGIAIDDAGNMYVADSNKIRKIKQNAQSNFLPINVIVNVVPAPTATAQSFCDAATVADLVATGTDLQWFDVAVGGTKLATSTPLASGTYFVSQTSNGCESTRAAVAASAGTITTWDGSDWDNDTPLTTSKAIINGDFTAIEDLIACSLEVTGTAVVSVPSGFEFHISGKITVASTASLTFENDANLFQIESVANAGNITVKRNSSALMRQDYTLWSSPVAGQQLLAFSPATLTTRFYLYNSTTNFYNAIAPTVDFNIGKGYLIRMPNTHPTIPTLWNGSFTGVPNNGDILVTMNDGGAGFRYNLVGNPYPSPILMEELIQDNSTITGTLYFWRKTNNPLSPSYCSWVGGTFITNGEAQVVDPDGIIQTGQGFFVEANGTGTSLMFKNGQRIDYSSQFFKTKAVKRNRIWLNATNTSGAFSQMAVGYITGATQEVDAFDGKYFNDGAIALSSILDNSDYAIQGRALPFNGTDVVPLHFSATTAGDYTIAIDHVDGLFSGNQDIILKDNSTGIETNLKNGAYTFVAAAGSDKNRFELKYQKTLGVDANDLNANSILVYKNKGTIQIKSSDSAIAKVKIFDIQGRLLFEKSKVNAKETSIESANFANQVLVVEITSDDNKKQIKKIIN
ncbi:MAG: hypothetical protein C0412_00330 [Flavobacterium sp.]|nr:hypothetical protein [Flavobacterium sp.]